MQSRSKGKKKKITCPSWRKRKELVRKGHFRKCCYFLLGMRKFSLFTRMRLRKQSYPIQEAWFLWLRKTGFWFPPLVPSPCYCRLRNLPSWFHDSWRMRCCYCLPSESDWGNWYLPGQDPRSLEGKENAGSPWREEMFLESQQPRPAMTYWAT